MDSRGNPAWLGGDTMQPKMKCNWDDNGINYTLEFYGDWYVVYKTKKPYLKYIL